MFKFVFKLILGLFVLAVVLVVIFFLSFDTILRVTAEHRIRAQTGMDAEIGTFHLGLLESVVTIKNLKLHNPPAFGGTPFLDIPEIHIEYDRDALRAGKIHLTLARFNLGELDIVKNEAGQTNIFSLGLNMPKVNKKSSGLALEQFKKQTGLTFQSVDVLNVSVGTAKYIDLKDPQNNREQKIGLENIPLRNIKTRDDLAGLMTIVALRGSDVFGIFVDTNANGDKSQLLNLLF